MNFPGVYDRIEFPVTFSLKDIARENKKERETGREKERERERERGREEERKRGRESSACGSLFYALSRLLVGRSTTNELD